MNNNTRFFALLTGKLLGDGCITKQQGRKPRFQFMHKKDDLGWTQYCFESLRDFLPLNPPVYKRVKDSRLSKGFSEAFFVQSKTNEIISFLELTWYKNRKKVLPIDFICAFLNPEALAWWYQDDGHLKLDKGIPRKIILSTDGFAIEENTFLVKLLEKKFKLLFSIDGQNRLILYDQVQIIYFLHLIAPYVHSAMYRKIHYCMPLKLLPQRTTIYLHTNYVLKKPTKDINTQLIHLNKLIHAISDRDSYLRFYKSNIPPLKEKKTLKSYQINLTEDNRINLSTVIKGTGLSISQATEWCFQQ